MAKIQGIYSAFEEVLGEDIDIEMDVLSYAGLSNEEDIFKEIQKISSVVS